MSAYFLPSHVHFCQRGDAFVFLDLRQDDYTLVNGPAASALKQLASQSRPDRDLSQDLSELVKGGLLTTEPQAAKLIAPTHVDLPAECIVDHETLRDTRVTLGHTMNFIAACTAAKLSLRWRKIEDTVMSVARRKERHAGKPFDIARAQNLTSVFLKLRSYFPANYLCLFDSLALLEFLAKYHVYPTWVFGVRLEPWAAHCWVQHQHWTLNEDVEQAAAYTPIMAI